MQAAPDQSSSVEAHAEGGAVAFNFQHRVFALPGAVFELDGNRISVLRFRLGEMSVAVSLAQIRIEFGLAPAEHLLLDKVDEGLKYVRMIRPGDQIPAELLDGRASWPTAERHLIAARRRIAQQLAEYSDEPAKTLPAEASAEEFAAEFQALALAASAQVAAQIGLPEDRKHEVLSRLDEFVAEYAYIEALRERVRNVLRIPVVADALRRKKQYESQSGELGRIVNLMDGPRAKFKAELSGIDDATADILSVLKNVQMKVVDVREVRDRLHSLNLNFEDLPEQWGKAANAEFQSVVALVRRTYGFLARNFKDSYSWSASA